MSQAKSQTHDRPIDELMKYLDKHFQMYMRAWRNGNEIYAQQVKKEAEPILFQMIMKLKPKILNTQNDIDGKDAWEEYSLGRGHNGLKSVLNYSFKTREVSEDKETGWGKPNKTEEREVPMTVPRKVFTEAYDVINTLYMDKFNGD